MHRAAILPDGVTGFAATRAPAHAVESAAHVLRPCSPVVRLDPVEELARVQTKYAPMRRSDIALYAAATVLLGIISLSRRVDWYFFLGALVAAAAWELTKYRLRRNARQFADSSHR